VGNAKKVKMKEKIKGRQEKGEEKKRNSGDLLNNDAWDLQFNNREKAFEKEGGGEAAGVAIPNK